MSDNSKKCFLPGILILILAFVGTGFTHIYAQVHIQATIPAVGLVQKNQLWNLVLVNGIAQPFKGRLELVLRDRQSGIELLTATTTGFTLPKGSLQTNVNLLSPIQYNYTGMEPNTSLNGLLPVGVYMACFSFYSSTGEKDELLSEECISFDVEPLSPPMLMFPADSAELDIQPSQFTWTPPTPSAMMNRLRYEILITEVKPGQKGTEAIQQNPPFYSNGDIRNNFLTYPASLPPFEKNKWYAWQVIAKDGSSYAAKTEVWTFNTNETIAPKPDPVSTSYILLRPGKDLSGINYVNSRQLHIKHYSFDKERIATIRFLSADGKIVKQVQQKIVYGDNFLSFTLGNRFKQDDVFTIEIIDAQKNVHSAFFSIR